MPHRTDEEIDQFFTQNSIIYAFPVHSCSISARVSLLKKELHVFYLELANDKVTPSIQNAAESSPETASENKTISYINLGNIVLST